MTSSNAINFMEKVHMSKRTLSSSEDFIKDRLLINKINRQAYLMNWLLLKLLCTEKLRKVSASKWSK